MTIPDRPSVAPPTASPADLLDLSGKVIAVTGAGGGIGTGIVERLMAAGADVVAHTRRSPVPAPTSTVAPRLVVTVDLTTEDGPRHLVDRAVEHCGRLDGLVNNAAIQPLAPLATLSDADWRAMLETNLTAAHRLTQATTRHLIDSGRSGTIVHIASIEASQPAPAHEHYAVAKAALVMHARAAAAAYGGDGIRVNAVSPGLIDRPGLSDDWPEGVQRWTSAAPLGRLGTPHDVGDACVFLCSELSRWVTGIDLVVDGGVLTRPTW